MINKVILMGRLGGDPELKQTPDGVGVAVFNLATNEYIMSKGERKEITEWHRVIVFGNMSKAIGDYLRKGDRVYVEGSIRSREYEDKEGVKRRIYEIVGRKVVFIDMKKKDGDTNNGSSVEGGSNGSLEDNDIPF